MSALRGFKFYGIVLWFPSLGSDLSQKIHSSGRNWVCSRWKRAARKFWTRVYFYMRDLYQWQYHRSTTRGQFVPIVAVTRWRLTQFILVWNNQVFIQNFGPLDLHQIPSFLANILLTYATVPYLLHETRTASWEVPLTTGKRYLNIFSIAQLNAEFWRVLETVLHPYAREACVAFERVTSMAQDDVVQGEMEEETLERWLLEWHDRALNKSSVVLLFFTFIAFLMCCPFVLLI